MPLVPLYVYVARAVLASRDYRLFKRHITLTLLCATDLLWGPKSSVYRDEIIAALDLLFPGI